MLLVTGSTGLIGSRVLRRLVDSGADVRCLVRDPRRLGEDRVRVQLTIGDMNEPLTFPGALRSVDTVVHMAAAVRDQKSGTIEEVNATGTWRLLQAAQSAGVKRFVFFSALNATRDSPARVLRSKAEAERAVADSPLATTILAPSVVYAADGRFHAALKRISVLPAVPVVGRGQARSEPIWADDVADCVIASLGENQPAARYELAGPQTLTADDFTRELLAGLGRKRPLIHVPAAVVRPALKAGSFALGTHAPLTWDELKLREIPMLSEHGTADAEALGIAPVSMRAALRAGVHSRA